MKKNKVIEKCINNFVEEINEQQEEFIQSLEKDEDEFIDFDLIF